MFSSVAAWGKTAESLTTILRCGWFMNYEFKWGFGGLPKCLCVPIWLNKICDASPNSRMLRDHSEKITWGGGGGFHILYCSNLGTPSHFRTNSEHSPQISANLITPSSHEFSFFIQICSPHPNPMSIFIAQFHILSLAALPYATYLIF